MAVMTEKRESKRSHKPRGGKRRDSVPLRSLRGEEPVNWTGGETEGIKKKKGKGK